MSTKSLFIGIIAIAALVLIRSTVYILPEYQKGVVLRFGELQPKYPQTGINFKLPLADEIVRFDGRVLTLDESPKILLTKNQKRLEVDSYAKWRVKDVGVYYVKTGGSERRAANSLSDRINRELANQLGKRTLEEAVSGKRLGLDGSEEQALSEAKDQKEGSKLSERDQIMTDLTKAINDAVGEELGIEITDIRVKKIELLAEVRDSVYARMETERNQAAQKFRSDGNKFAEEKRAGADRQKIVIEANAYKESELIRGEGDARATAIYASAYNKDAEFYSFVRSLNAYQTTFNNKGDVMLVDPKSDFFRYLKNPNGGSEQSTQRFAE